MENRKDPRFVCEYSISFEGVQLTGSGTVSNLSMGGCTLQSDTDSHNVRPHGPQAARADPSVKSLWGDARTHAFQFNSQFLFQEMTSLEKGV